MKFDLICISSIEMTKATTSRNGDWKKKGGLIVVGVIAGIAVVVAVVFFILYLRQVL